MKSENHFLTGVRAGLSDSGSNFGKRGGRNLGHCVVSSFKDLTSSVTTVL